MYNIGKLHCCFGCHISELFPGIIVRRCYIWKFSSYNSGSIKSTFTVSRYLREPPSVLNIIFQRGTYDMTTGEAIKNELKVAIPLEFLYKKP